MSSKEINENVVRWSLAFSENTSKNICSLYDEQASLWGTLSAIKCDSPALIKDYFDNIFKYSDRSVKVTDSNIRFYNDIAICNGQYIFSWFKNDAKVTTAARFSFVFINRDGCWLIIEHHSSTIPILPIQDNR